MDTTIYEAALARAHTAKIKILATSQTDTGLRTWHVSSSKDPEGDTGHYTVRHHRGERLMSCNCDGGLNGNYCMHRALVHEDENAKAEARAAHVAPTPAPTPARLLADGRFTVVLASGERRTIRIRTQPTDAGFAAGERIMAYLSGADNDTAYTRFAFYSLKGDGKVHIWARFAAESVLAQCARVLEDVDAAEAAGLAYALESGNCWRCGHTLTVPASIHAGVGPECAKKLEGAA